MRNSLFRHHISLHAIWFVIYFVTFHTHRVCIYYNSLPPVAKTFAVVCLLTSGAYHLDIYDDKNIALIYSEVFKHFQIWRLVTNFFFLAPFSIWFAFRFLIILRNGVSLERGPFDKRTADYLWMFIFGAFSLLVMTAIPFLWTPFLGPSLVFMIIYIWGREFPNERLNIHGLFELKGFYLPWYVLAIDLILGQSLKPPMLGMVAGHFYYFLTVLYPLSSGNNYCKTPLWVHKLVAFWGVGFQANSPLRNIDASAGVAFRGRSFRLSGGTTNRAVAGSRQEQPTNGTLAQVNSATGGAFSGRSYRLNAT